MSILLATEDGWLISHLDYLNDVYKRVQHEQKYRTLKFNETLFELTSPYLRQSQIDSRNKLQNSQCPAIDKRKRKAERTDTLPHEVLEQNDFVKNTCLKILNKAQTLKLFKNAAKDNNVKSRDESRKFYTKFICSNHDFHGGNKEDIPITAEFQKEKYVFPENSEFFCYDIRQIKKVFNFSKKFDLILLDPPWWNKAIRRKKKKFKESSYDMMYNEEITKLPIQDLLSSQGIVAVWCTNSSTHLNSILNEMFPHWGVTFMAKWYWLKVTQNGETICNFNDIHAKQPYEQLIFGTVITNFNYKIPDKKIIISVPSAVHSHKPPLTEILKLYLPTHPNCMEIFARYLLPNWTSWGLEVLKFQHLTLYNIIEKEEKSEESSI